MPRKFFPRLSRFSLRTALILIFVAAAYFSYVLHLEASRRQLIEEIEAAGGSVVYDQSVRWTLFHSQRVAFVQIPWDTPVELYEERLHEFPHLAGCEFTASATLDGE
ncbi:MAG: hypothetical protein AAFU85_20520 [Planctomycetota bacterium]